MNEIEIKVLDMSAVLKPSDSFALVLEELGGHFRKLALIIGKQEVKIRILQSCRRWMNLLSNRS